MRWPWNGRSWDLLRRRCRPASRRADAGGLALRWPAPERWPSPGHCWATPRLVLDEPTAALGVAQTAQVLNLVEQLRERGLAVVLISHNMADVFAVADRISVLRLGRNAGDFRVGQTSNEEVVAAITGAVDNVVAQRAGPRRPGARKARDRPDGRDEGGDGVTDTATGTAPTAPTPPADRPADRPGATGVRRQVWAGLGGVRSGDLGSLPIVVGLLIIVGDLPGEGADLPQLQQPGEPGLAGRLDRDHRGRCHAACCCWARSTCRSARSAARPRRSWPWPTSSTDLAGRRHRAGAAGRAGDRAGAGLVFTRFGVPSFVVTLAGLLVWQGVQRRVLAETGTINLPRRGWLLEVGQFRYSAMLVRPSWPRCWSRSTWPQPCPPGAPGGGPGFPPGTRCGPFHRASFELQQDVARLEAGLRGRAVRHDLVDRTPLASFEPNERASSGVSGWIETPSQPRVTRPFSRSSV